MTISMVKVADSPSLACAGPVSRNDTGEPGEGVVGDVGAGWGDVPPELGGCGVLAPVPGDEPDDVPAPKGGGGKLGVVGCVGLGSEMPPGDVGGIPVDGSPLPGCAGVEVPGVDVVGAPAAWASRQAVCEALIPPGPVICTVWHHFPD